jgi:N-acetylmuramoyl-L-alanine amidase CwlA
MNSDLDVRGAYKRAALLVAVLAFQNGLKVPGQIVQHHDWSGKDCPRVLREKPKGWETFVNQIKAIRSDLTDVPAAKIALSNVKDHHLSE